MRPGDLLQKIPEFHATQSIKLAPNTPVPVTERILKLVDAQSFQRLRKVRQLSMSERVFPSATHTRFSHALGVYANVLDYLRHLDRFDAFRARYGEEDYLAVMLAGLLHDLGHYPCAHQLEHVPPFPLHEELTIAMIKGDLRFEGEDLGALIRDHFGIDPRRVAELLGSYKTLAPEKHLLKQIIDSPNDADKCDYLPRDSYYCGVDYGAAVDRHRFIENLVPSGDGHQLCVHEKGLMSAERFQLARYWMYRSVYWGHTVRALIMMLSKACTYMKPVSEESRWLVQLMNFNDHNFLEWLHGQVEEPGQELISMLHHRREPYKRVYTVAFHHASDNYRAMQNDPDARDAIVGWLCKFVTKHGATNLAEHDFIWDVPPVYKDKTWETFPIKLSTGGESSIDKESPIINALSETFLYGVRKIRLFCHPRLGEIIDHHRDQLPPIHEFLGLFPPEVG